MDAFAPGRIIDRYEVVRRIGAGGMADVYLVRHRNLGTTHALKVLVIRSEDIDARFVREGVVQSQLDHPHIVRVRDVLDVDGGPGLLMDYVNGMDLHDLAARGPLSVDETLGLAHGILRGLAFAHGRGVIHRDLKPSNVLLERSGGGLVPHLADFGLAKALAGPGAVGLRTRTGIMLGTPAYMPPEQMRDAARVDARADLFSVGVLLYSVLAGREPWPGPSLIQVVRARKQGMPPRIDAIRSEVPDAVARAVQAMIALDREARTATAADALEGLGLEVEPVAMGLPPVTGPQIARCLA